MNCKIDGCRRKVSARGVCNTHYRLEKYGRCLNGCTQPANDRRGMCSDCLRRGSKPPRTRDIGKRLNTNTHKYCPRCTRVLPHDEFYGNRANGGLMQICGTCTEKRKFGFSRQYIYEYMARTVEQTANNLCVKCERGLGEVWEIDHILPITLGGPNSMDNYQIMCPNCNRKKGNKEAVDYRRQIV